MNNSTIQTTTNADLSSLQNLLNRRPADVSFIVVGSITVFLNFLIILNIIKSKTLRTKCYFLIANSSAAAIIYSGSFAITAVKRILRFYFGVSEVKTKLMCNLEMFTCYFGQSACASLPLATAIDRLLATVVPVKYRNMGSRGAGLLSALGWVYAAVDSGFTFYGSKMNSIVLNCNLVSTTDMLYEIQSSCAIALAATVVIIYVSVMILLQNQIKQAKSKSQNTAVKKAKLRLKVARALSVDSCVHLITQVSTRIGLALLPLFPYLNQWTTASYMRITLFLGSSLSFFVFMTLNSEFRRCFLRLVGLANFVSHQTEIPPGTGPLFLTTRINKEKEILRSNINCCVN